MNPSKLAKLCIILQDLKDRYYYMDFELCRDQDKTCIKTRSFLMALLIEDSLISNGFPVRISHRLDGSIYLLLLEDGNEVEEWLK